MLLTTSSAVTDVCADLPVYILQAGGYFSILVCVATWWLAIAELTFDVTGKVSHCLLHSIYARSVHFFHHRLHRLSSRLLMLSIA